MRLRCLRGLLVSIEPKEPSMQLTKATTRTLGA